MRRADISEICATVTGRDVEALRRARDAAERDADLVELRVDSMERPDAAGALAGRRRPAIVTCRPVREGGMFAGPEEERLRVLEDAHRAGAEFIDVEWDADLARIAAPRNGRGVVVSRHVFDATPPDPGAMLGDLRGRGVEIAKLAVMTERLADLSQLLAIGRVSSSIVIGMGPAGLATRVLAARFGSRWTYAGDAVAPGQISAARLLREFQFRRISPGAAVFGVLGHPIAHSLSPAMHNAGFAARSLDAVYVPFDTRDLDALRRFAGEIDLRGASVTIPFKQAVMPLLDEIDDTAASAGAVNTIAIRDGRWTGLNTDVDGFVEPLRRRIPNLAGVRVTILGAGGSARGVALALQRTGARVTLAARRDGAARAVAGAVGARAGDWPPRPRSWDVLVNATPVGSRDVDGTPFDGPFDGRIVYDLVYDPDPTPLTAAAAAAGVETIGGIDMLVAQAERQFEIWTGERPPARLFAEAAAGARRSRAVESVPT